MHYRLCALIPTYNHHTRLPAIAARLKAAGLEVLIVDDGSHEETQNTLRGLEGVNILRLPVNGGKGAAVAAGLKWAAGAGYTHAFQIDADGQHSLAGLEAFILKSQKSPRALLSGKPIYDSTRPLGRKIGRWFTHIWVWVETLSFRISDSMCGFRIYPVQAALDTLNNASIGSRMDFDTEIMVRMFWGGTPVIMHPVKVSYPEGNHSNFSLLDDNWRITKMHTRLVVSMLTRLPEILSSRPDYRGIEAETAKWFDMSERGTFLGLFLLASCYRVLGRTACSIIGAPVVLYFYLTGAKQRRASSQFLSRVFQMKNSNKQPSWTDGLRHFMSFFQMLLDKLSAWGGHLNLDRIECDDPDYIRTIMTSRKGGVMFVSHLGCMEFCRALMSSDQKKRMHILMHTKNAARFNRAMTYFNPQSNLNILEVTEMGPDTMLFLKDRIEEGDWVVIAADRIPVSENPRTTPVPFLGEEAPFPQGPFILASLLQCPVYTAMAIRKGSNYQVSIKPFADQIRLPRGSKEACIREYAHQYAQYLERYCIENPYQWYNFFDFWGAARGS